LQPTVPSSRRGTALIEVPNRGGRAALAYFARARRAPDDVGDGLLLRLGLTVVWIGWQQDVPSGLRLAGPVLTQPDGAPLAGPVRADWVVDRTERRLPLGHRQHAPFPPVEPASGAHVLTRRTAREAPREVVLRNAWRFTDEGNAIEGSFEPGFVYELVYRARDPRVTGLGFAAVRDVASWLENAPDCPCHVDRTVAFGISQTGRFLRHMIWQGFVTDTDGRPTLDGVLVLTAGAGRGSFNHRFAQPSRDAHAYSAFFFPTDLFPFTSALQEDPVTGRIDGLFARQHDPQHLPKVFWVNGGYEYWGRAAAAIHTSVDGTRDVEPTARERIYHLAGAQHYQGDLRSNPIELASLHRALLTALLAWVEDGTAPPESRYPRIADGTLVTPERLAPPAIPGVAWPARAHVAYRADYGPDFVARGLVTVEPPELGPAFPALVPAVDALGNERGGLAPLELRVPVGTFLPWSLRSAPPDVVADFVGRWVPLAVDEAGKGARDARPSLAERYGSREAFLEQVREAAAQMVRERVLLAEDVERVTVNMAGLWDAAAGNTGRR
jgi:hypothetical protein